MQLKKKFLQLKRKFDRRGEANIYIVGILGAVVVFSFFMVGGITPGFQAPDPNSRVVQPDFAAASSSNKRNSLQLVTFGYITPTPTPTPSPTPPPTTPTTTPEPLACLDKTVITLSIDLSASMANDGKIGALQSALGDFIDGIRPETVVGGTGFGAESFNTDGTEGVTHIMGYTKNKTLLKDRLVALQPGPEGGTFIRNGFRVAINRINAVKSTYPDSEYRYVTIFFSDGVPEMYDYRNPTCYARDGVVCWAREQDPRNTPYGLTSTNYVTGMDNITDKVYTVAIYNSTPGTRGAALTPQLVTLLQTIASGTSRPYYQAVDLRNGQARDLTSFFKAIVDDVCK